MIPYVTELEMTWHSVKAAVGHMGPVVIAGGAVRDAMIQRRPKDLDVFVMKTPFNDETRSEVSLAMAKSGLFAGASPELEWHQSEPFLVGEWWIGSHRLQLMLSEKATPLGLLDTFDWDVSRFCYDGHDWIRGQRPAEGEWLTLHKVTFPVSTLRRGFRFSERYKMRLRPEDIHELCKQAAARYRAREDA